MSVYSGPGLINDGLVFYYDMDNTDKSWKGKPTTNLISSLGDPEAEYARGEFGQYFNLVDPFEQNGLVPYSLSFEAKGNIPGGIFVYMQNGSYTKYSFVGQSINLSTEWQRFKFENITPSGPTAAWQTNTPGDNRAMLATYTGYGSGINPTLKNIQLELGSFATPFVASTRSNTQAILDLTGNNAVTASNLTYNSDNTFQASGLDGSNISVTNIDLAQDFSLECWVYLNALQGGFFGHGPTSSRQGLHITIGSNSTRFGMYANDTDFAFPHQTGVWANYVFTYNHTTFVKKGYRNSVEYNGIPAQAQTSWIGSPGTLRIGQNYGSYSGPSINGIVSVAKMYNRVLTTDEVRQNFNAHRARYGI